MSVGFQLGHNNHKTVEDFLARGPHQGVCSITVHPKVAKHQRAAAEAATAAGIEVYFNPATERLVAPGYDMPGIPYFRDDPYDLDHLAGDAAARELLVAQVVDGHPDYVTAVTPPHFFVNSSRTASLNQVLAADTVHATDRPVRPVLVLDRRYGAKNATDLAAGYAQAGMKEIELRLGRFGGEDMSLAVIQSAFGILGAFSAAGIAVTLGWAGNIGSVAVAFGRASAYTVGVGEHESMNYTAMITAQGRPPVLDENGKKKSGGGGDGVYLPGIAHTVTKKVAQGLLGHSDIRLRLGCRLGSCSTSVSGPTLDPRGHYLHSRASEMAQLQGAPARWRSQMEMERLRKALGLRELINDRYPREDGRPIPTRTLKSILDLTGAAEATQTA